MGFIFFVVLMLLELALMIYRIKEKTLINKSIAKFRLAELLIVLLLSLSVGPKMGARYATLITLFGFLAIGAFRYLVSGNGGKAQYSKMQVIRRALGMGLLYLIAILPIIFFPGYDMLATTGEYQVANGVDHFTDFNRFESYRSDSRPRTLTVEFWYPEQGIERYPLIVFSHGAFGTRRSNETLYRELASHGYVVFSIDHTYQCLYTTDPNGRLLVMSRDYVQEIIGENAKTNKDSSAKLYKKWMNVRLADLNFVLDTIISNVPRYPKDSLYRRIDPQKIGLIGHSLGGAAVLGVGRQRKGVQAVIALEAPFLCDIKGVQNGEFVFDESPYPRPLLNIYSDSSWSHLAEWPQYATNARLLQTENKDLYNIYLEGTGHLGLTDLSLVSPFWTRILDGRPPKINPQEALMQINGSCLTFLNYVLKRNKSMDLEI